VENDETNKDESYRRNWLRNNIIPQINEKRYNLQTVVKKRYHIYLNKKGE
jgi:tRNA(Ile)-lysidine synthase TilS/MesJ